MSARVDTELDEIYGPGRKRNASDESARTGFYIFASVDPTDREMLNGILAARGLDPISKRTWAHYNKLRKYGFKDYLPINHLDVAIAQGRVK